MPFFGVVSEKWVAEPAARSARHSAGSTPGHSRQREKIQLPNLIKNSLTVSAPCGLRSKVNCLREERLNSIPLSHENGEKLKKKKSSR